MNPLFANLHAVDDARTAACSRSSAGTRSAAGAMCHAAIHDRAALRMAEVRCGFTLKFLRHISPRYNWADSQQHDWRAGLGRDLMAAGMSVLAIWWGRNGGRRLRALLTGAATRISMPDTIAPDSIAT